MLAFATSARADEEHRADTVVVAPGERYAAGGAWFYDACYATGSDGVQMRIMRLADGELAMVRDGAPTCRAETPDGATRALDVR